MTASRRLREDLVDSTTSGPLVSLRYSGSKRKLLRGPLGPTLIESCRNADRFVDLCCGSGIVAHHIALETSLPVIATDLQRYATILAAAIVERTDPVDDDLIPSWFARGAHAVEKALQTIETRSIGSQDLTAQDIVEARAASGTAPDGFVLRDYGGHYFSPAQAVTMDGLLRTLPVAEAPRRFALACLLVAAARISASPGHLAQPFQPKPNQLPWIQAAWRRDVFYEINRVATSWGPIHARTAGVAHDLSAHEAASSLVCRGDVVFCDPPYSDVQYSRLYHVLEGLARGGWPHVSGAGRAPEAAQRRRSELSVRSAPARFANLLDVLFARRPDRVVVTVPGNDGGNGLTGASVSAMAAPNWHVEQVVVTGQQSTLGGTPAGRGTRRTIDEHIVLLRPRC